MIERIGIGIQCCRIPNSCVKMRGFKLSKVGTFTLDKNGPFHAYVPRIYVAINKLSLSPGQHVAICRHSDSEFATRSIETTLSFGSRALQEFKSIQMAKLQLGQRNVVLWWPLLVSRKSDSRTSMQSPHRHW